MKYTNIVKNSRDRHVPSSSSNQTTIKRLGSVAFRYIESIQQAAHRLSKDVADVVNEDRLVRCTIKAHNGTYSDFTYYNADGCKSSTWNYIQAIINYDDIPEYIVSVDDELGFTRPIKPDGHDFSITNDFVSGFDDIFRAPILNEAMEIGAIRDIMDELGTPLPAKPRPALVEMLKDNLTDLLNKEIDTVYTSISSEHRLLKLANKKIITSSTLDGNEVSILPIAINAVFNNLSPDVKSFSNDYISLQ